MGILVLFAALAATHTFTYDADVLPNRARPPWSFREIENCSAVVEAGVLHVRDNGTAQGELQFISYSWAAVPDRPHSLEARVKVANCSGPSGVVMLAANGVREVGLTLFPDHFLWTTAKAVWAVVVDGTKAFRAIRMDCPPNT